MRCTDLNYGYCSMTVLSLSTSELYPVESLSNADAARNDIFHLTSRVNEVNATSEDSAQHRMNSVVKAIKKAASSSIGITPPTRSSWQGSCSEITRMSHEQKMLRLPINKTIDIETRNALKQECNRPPVTARP